VTLDDNDTNECDACRSRLSVATLILLRLAAILIERAGAVRSTLDVATNRRNVSTSTDHTLEVATRVLLWVAITLEVAVLLALMAVFKMLTGG
jgi:hypothetical protein